MTEAAIGLPLFFVIVIVGIDLLLVAYTSLSLQFITTVVMRQASLAEQSDVEVANYANSLARRFGVAVRSDEDVFMCPTKVYPAQCGTLSSGFNQGEAGQLILLKVNSRVSTLLLGPVLNTLANRELSLSKTVVMRREAGNA